MSPLLLTALLLAAAPSPQRAQQLAKSKSWEDLYLAYSAADPNGYSEADRKAIAAPLLKGCEALVGNDAVMAYSLGERSVAFEQSPGGLRCLARAALATDQRSAAEEALRKGLELFSQEGAFGLELGRMLVEDADGPAAIAALEKVPPRSPQATEAKKLLQQARNLSTEQSKARAEAEKLERRMNNAKTKPATAHDEGDTRPSGLSYESGVSADGMRIRSNRRFMIKYFNNDRDFGQRAEYEGKVVAALEEAYEHTLRVLGQAREGTVDVILYTREEFKTHQGASMAKAAAGLYSDGAMRINNSAELTEQTKSTLVHEYVHAAMDEICAGGGQLPTWLSEGVAEYVAWRYLGHEGPPPTLANALRTAARGNRLPSLANLSQGMLIQTSNPGLAYATSAAAVWQLMRWGGSPRLLALVRAVSQGTPFDKALEAHYDIDVARLDSEVKAALSQR